MTRRKRSVALGTVMTAAAAIHEERRSTGIVGVGLRTGKLGPNACFCNNEMIET